MTTHAQVPSESPPAPDQAAYLAVARSDEFATLRRSLRRFVFPMTVAFFAWYLLYVIMSAYARDFMAIDVVGNINVALIFGLLQFVSTFGIAWLYSRYAGRKLDPLATKLHDEVVNHGGAGGDK